MSNSRVDCIVKMPEPPGPICIDSKFPLEDYKKFASSSNDQEKKDNLKLSTSLNWSKNTNEVTDLFGTESINLSPGASVSSRAIVGQQLGVLFGTGSLTNPDGSYILDANGFPQITPSPVILGDPNPDWRA